MPNLNLCHCNGQAGEDSNYDPPCTQVDGVFTERNAPCSQNHMAPLINNTQ